MQPGTIVLVVQFEPTLRRLAPRSAARVPQYMSRAMQARLVIEALEFKGLLEGKTDQDAPAIFIDEVATRRIIPEISHLT
ncbi:hypothetical protein AS156_22150 [Bradyrhizobium macuxiense]|uniref:Uncharacterized protein n=1 Tax=Bradyrhizobium macuxiense TaxID=1755647 RepID=A0A109JBW7_9BRAD|nr:hypothetical protein AS156_22150 [Bradyrhizobium macuxiense]